LRSSPGSHTPAARRRSSASCYAKRICLLALLDEYRNLHNVPVLMSESLSSPTQSALPQGSIAESPPVRYMGTKRLIAPIVGRVIREHCPRTSRVSDLFAGLGSVTTELASTHSVALNDAQRFTGPLARARFLNSPRSPLERLVPQLRELFDDALRELQRIFADRLCTESAAFIKGIDAVREYLTSAPHVGNFPEFRRSAAEADRSEGKEHYRLTTLYFSGGYFSTQQSMELDALRYAIDQFPDLKDWLLAAWISAASTIINSPGHTAQYLKPSGPAGFARFSRQWRRSVWHEFLAKLASIQLVGTHSWRARNTVHHTEDLAALSDPDLRDVRLVYADPPYTKDQYSRYYHVYETMFLYDYPDVEGKGRYRKERFRSPYSLPGQVLQAFSALLGKVAESGRFLVLSYPCHGLLSRRGHDLDELLASYFLISRKISFPWRYSSLGAAKGSRFVEAHEQIFFCVPR